MPDDPKKAIVIHIDGELYLLQESHYLGHPVAKTDRGAKQANKMIVNGCVLASIPAVGAGFMCTLVNIDGLILK